MTIKISMSEAETNLENYLNKVAMGNEIVVIDWPQNHSVALVTASELASLTETAYLLKNPYNADRLLRALWRAKKKLLIPIKIDNMLRYFNYPGVEKQSNEDYAIFQPEFLEDLRFWIKENSNIAIKVMDLVKIIVSKGKESINKHPNLKYIDAKMASRMLHEQHRLVYVVNDNIEFLQCFYYDKPPTDFELS